MVHRHATLAAEPPGCDGHHVQLQHVLDRMLDNPHPAPHLLAFGADHHRVEPLQTRPIAPEDALIGLVLPPQFTALVVVAPAAATRQNDRTIGRPAMIAIATCRCGRSCTALNVDGERLSGRAPSGWVVDATMRAVGRPCAPTERHPTEALLCLWLDRLLVSVLDPTDRPPLTWLAAVAAAPVSGIRTTAHELAHAFREAAPSWGHLRRRAAIGDLAGLGVRPHWAGAMDDPMFGRFALGNFPELDELRSDIELLVPADVGEQIHRCVATTLASPN